MEQCANKFSKIHKVTDHYNLNNKPLKRKHQEDSNSQNSQYFPNTDKKFRGNDGTYSHNNQGYYENHTNNQDNIYYKIQTNSKNNREYRSTLYQYIDNNEFTKLYNMLSKMSAKHTFSFIELCKSLIHFCATKNKSEDTVYLLKKLQKLNSNLKKDSKLYTHVIQCCIKDNNSYYAIKLFETMLKNNIKLEEKVYTSVIQYCANKALFAHMIIFFDRMLQDKITPNEILCTTIMKYATIYDNSPIEFFHRMIKDYTPINGMLYVTAINRCITEGYAIDAERVLETGLEKGIFKSNLGFDDNTLNLHGNAIINQYNENTGVPCVFGKFILDKVILYNNLSNIIIVVGRYGANHLKNMVLDYAQEMGYIANIDTWNPGRIHLQIYPK